MTGVVREAELAAEAVRPGVVMEPRAIAGGVRVVPQVDVVQRARGAQRRSAVLSRVHDTIQTYRRERTQERRTAVHTDTRARARERHTHIHIRNWLVFFCNILTRTRETNYRSKMLTEVDCKSDGTHD